MVVGKPENAALRQASVRNWQGCKRITPLQPCMRRLGAPPAHDRPHSICSPGSCIGPSFLWRREGPWKDLLSGMPPRDWRVQAII